MSTLTLYGLNHCDACRKARAWLESHGLSYRFHDIRSDGLPPSLLEEWESRLGWETLLNRRSTTWRGLSDIDRSDLDRARALALMAAHPTLVKRPILTSGDRVLAGFSPEAYAEAL